LSSILKVRDENGNFIDIPAIKGDDGKSAYELAVEGGYKGSEEDFIATLNASLSEVTAEQIGAVKTDGSNVMTGNLQIRKDNANVTFGTDDENTAILVYTENSNADLINVKNAKPTTLSLSNETVLALNQLLRLWTSDGQFYNIYGEHNKPTATDVGALPLSGGTLTGSLLINNLDSYYAIKKGRIINDVNLYLTLGVGSNGSTVLEHYTEDTLDARMELDCENGKPTLNLCSAVDSGVSQIYGEHNKPSGSYVGNNQERDINIGGIGDVLLIMGEDDYTALITPYDNLYVNTKNVSSSVNSAVAATFSDGVLHITQTTLFNTSGITYRYYVL